MGDVIEFTYVCEDCSFVAQFLLYPDTELDLATDTYYLRCPFCAGRMLEATNELSDA